MVFVYELSCVSIFAVAIGRDSTRERSTSQHGKQTKAEKAQRVSAKNTQEMSVCVLLLSCTLGTPLQTVVHIDRYRECFKCRKLR